MGYFAGHKSHWNGNTFCDGEVIGFWSMGFGGGAESETPSSVRSTVGNLLSWLVWNRKAHISE